MCYFWLVGVKIAFCEGPLHNITSGIVPEADGMCPGSITETIDNDNDLTGLANH